MEAATALPFSRVEVRNGRLAIEALVIEDETAVRLAAEHPEPARLVVDAVEIGARVLDREQTGAAAELVRAEMEEASRRFTEHAARLAERMDEKVDSVFGADDGELSRIMARHFGEESNVAVQHRVKAVLAEVAAQMREDVRKQLTADSEDNPIVAIQRASLKVVRDNASQQAEHLRLMADKLEAMKLEVAELRAEKDKLEEVAAAEEKGTAKGRTYEEAVFEAVDAIAVARGDDCDAVGDTRGEGGKKGDVVVAVDACAGPARGRIVFEAKDRKLSKNEALAELDGALETRNADYAVLVVPSEQELPARTHPLREFNGNKLFVVHDPADGSRLALDVAYGLARARVLMAREEVGGLDAAAVRAEVERAAQGMEDVRRIKSQLTNATNGIDQARSILDAMATTVRGHLAQIDSLLAVTESVDNG